MDINQKLTEGNEPQSKTYKHKFHKLTLSSKKKQPAEHQTTPKKCAQQKVLYNARSNLFYESSNSTENKNDEFLTDDESENDIDSNNKILLSSSNGKQYSKENTTQNFSEKLQITDSDITNCSSVSDPNKNIELETQMSKLELTGTVSDDLFSSETDMNNQFPLSQKQIEIISDLSQKIDQLELENKVERKSIYLTGTTVDNESFSKCLTPTGNKSIKEECDKNSSIITVSSSSKSNNSTVNNSFCSDENIIDIISLHDTEDEEDIDVENMTAKSSTENLFSVEISQTAVQKLDDFFNNIPLLDSSHVLPEMPDIFFKDNKQNQLKSLMHNDIIHPEIDSSEKSPHKKIVNTTLCNESAANSESSSIHSLIVVSETSVEPEEYDAHISQNTVQNTSKHNDNTSNSPKKTSYSSPLKELNKSSQIVKSTQSEIQTPSSQKNTAKINISAKINIKIHVSALSSSTESLSSVSADSKYENVNHTSIINQPSVNNAFLNIPHKVTKNESPQLSNYSMNNVPNKSQVVLNAYECETIQNFIKNVADTSRSNTSNNSKIYDQSTDKKLEKSAEEKNGTNVSTPDLTRRKNVNNNENQDEEIDEEAEALLNELYGSEWQTPDLLKKCSTKKHIISKTKIVDRCSNGFDFFSVRRDICSDLESTRIIYADKPILPKNNVQNGETNKIVVGPTTLKMPDFNLKKSCETRTGNRKVSVRRDICSDLESTQIIYADKPILPKNNVQNGETNKIVGPTTLKMPDFNLKKSCETRTGNRKAVKNKIIRSDTESDVSDEYTFSDSECSTSESANDQISKKKGRKKKKSAAGIVYLDLTNVEAIVEDNHTSPNATEEDLEKLIKNSLESFEFKKKQYTLDASKNKMKSTSTNSSVSKRKLFTPTYHYADVAENVNDDNADDRQLKKTVMSFQTPINKRLENIKSTECLSEPIKKLTAKNRNLKSAITPKVHTNKNNQIIEDASSKFGAYGFLRSFDPWIPKRLCHPDAIIYVDNFKDNKLELTTKLYTMYNEHIFKNKLDVPIDWNKKLLTTAGRCLNSKKQGARYSRIELSDKVITSADRLRCTLIHELCHAAAWIHNGTAESHGEDWKYWAKKSNTKFPELPIITVCHQYDIQYRYTYKCTLCAAKSHAHTKSKKVENIRCAYCHGSIEIYLNKKQKHGNVVETPVRQATGFAKFVKETYRNYKTPGRTHGDVMKLLSNAFSSLKVTEKNKY